MNRQAVGTIGVLMGGPSSEQEISRKSGHAVVQALQQANHDVVAIDLQEHETTFDAVAQRVQAAHCDVMFNALHGTFGEDGTVQQFLENLQIPYTGSRVTSSRVAFDKWATRQRLLAVGVMMPHAVRISRTDAATVLRDGQFLSQEGTFPKRIVVKPIHQGSSHGVSIIDTPQALVEAVGVALDYDDEVLLEHYIAGRELAVSIFDGQALPIVEIHPEHGSFFDFASKYTAGATTYTVPAALDELTTLRVQHAALATHRALECRHFSRVDIILDAEDSAHVLELNTIPGLTSTSLLPMAAQACGCSFATLCEHMVAMALEQHETLTMAGS